MITQTPFPQPFLQWYILNGTGLRMSGVHINLKIRGDLGEGRGIMASLADILLNILQ